MYGITNPLIDVDRGLYEPVGIHEVPTFHSEKKTSCGHLLPFFIAVPIFLQKRTCASFSVHSGDDFGALGCQQWISQILRTLWLQRSSAWSILLFSEGQRPPNTLLSPLLNPLEGSIMWSCEKLGPGGRSKLPALKRGRGVCYKSRD